MLKKDKFEMLCVDNLELADFYSEFEKGFFRLKKSIPDDELKILKALFQRIGFSALNFTDSRSKFAFYNLRYLWGHIGILLNNGVTAAHMACEPVSANEVYKALYGTGFKNEIASQPFDYAFFKTNYANILGGKSGFIFNKEQTVCEIINFVGEELHSSG
jgi:hypothetical protein